MRSCRESAFMTCATLMSSPRQKNLLIFRNFLFGSVIAFFLHSLLRRKTLAAFLFRPATGTRNACPRSYNKNRFSYISPFPLCRYKNVLCNVLYFNPLTGKNKHLTESVMILLSLLLSLLRKLYCIFQKRTRQH